MENNVEYNKILLSFAELLDNFIKLKIDINKQNLLKENSDLAKTKNPAPSYLRDSANDRIFPLDTVSIEKTSQDNKITNPVIHTGSYADELARMMNAVAVTIGKDIYFRHGSYRPESEEGRALLSHELTHVGQYEEKRIAEGIDKEELEKEAIESEKKEIYESDPVVSVKVGEKVYRIRKSGMRKVESLVTELLKEWIEKEKNLLSEEEYLNLLIAASEYMGEE